MEWTNCVECGTEFPRVSSKRQLCSNRCVQRRWRRRHPGVDLHHTRMSTKIDRRPWLILSRAEALALQQAALASLERNHGLAPLPEALARALRVIDRQVRYIDGAADGAEPNVLEALLREERVWDA